MSPLKSALLVLSLCFALASFAVTPAPPIEGNWLGTLNVQGASLRLVIRISRAADSLLTAMLDSPDQGAKDIPADEVSYADGSLHVGVKKFAGAYTGKWQDSTSAIEGTWTQGGRTFPLTLKRVDTVPELARPQEPKKPYPYLEEEIRFVNSRGGDTLAGTLTRPSSGGPFPVALLITGSGPQDRDETVFGHRPFLVLADYLTRQGMAVLRVDDRGVGKSTGNFARATMADFAGDVEAAVEFLKGRKDIDKKKIGLIGHSEGALLTAMVAAHSKDVAFIVNIAGPGVTGEQIIYQQGDLISKAQGIPDTEIERNRALREQMFFVVKEDHDSLSAARRLRALLTTPEMASDSARPLIDRQIVQLLSPWMRSFIVYDPRPDLKKVKCPVLAVFGEKDLQVPLQPSASEVADALKKGKSHSYEVKIMPGLNHLMQTATTGSPGEYVKIEETFNPAALKFIGDWIAVHLRK